MILANLTKIAMCLIYSTLVASMCFSCSDSTIMYFHEDDPEKEATQLFQISYPQNDKTMPNIYQELFYNENGKISRISMDEEKSSVSIEYFDQKIVAKIVSQQEGASLQEEYNIILNDKNQIIYALRLYTEDTGTVKQDSLCFKYDQAGYMVHSDYYEGIEQEKTNMYRLKYCQVYTVSDSNIVSMRTLNGDRYVYTYNNNKHIDASEFCTEMPKAAHLYSKESTFPILLPALYDYLGTKSVNNIIRLDIAYAVNSETDVKTGLDYSYIYSTTDILKEVILNGTLNDSLSYSDQSIMFFYN